MERLYHDSDLNSTFKKIALAVEKMEKVLETEELQAKTVHQTYTDLGKISIGGFKLFAEKHGISPNNYQIRSRNASFLIPIFRELEQIYGVTREKWWWHDSTFTYWFDRLKDDRLKLTLELGPLQADQRLVIINRLAELGISFSYQSKLPTSRYTRLFSKAKVLNNWEDVEEVYKGMEDLYNDPRNQEMIQMIETLK